MRIFVRPVSRRPVSSRDEDSTSTVRSPAATLSTTATARASGLATVRVIRIAQAKSASAVATPITARLTANPRAAFARASATALSASSRMSFTSSSSPSADFELEILYLAVNLLRVEIGVLERIECAAVLAAHGCVGREELLQRFLCGRKLDRVAQLLAGAPRLPFAELELLPAFLERFRVRPSHENAHPLRHLVLERAFERLGLDRLRDQRVVHLRHSGEPASRGGEAEDRTADDQGQSEHEHRQDLVANAACEPVHRLFAPAYMRSWNNTPTMVAW